MKIGDLVQWKNELSSDNRTYGLILSSSDIDQSDGALILTVVTNDGKPEQYLDFNWEIVR